MERFLDAQSQAYGGFATALAEMESGAKRSHWIWYVFPQLAGLGRSPLAQQYALAGLAEAQRYLEHPVLRARYLEITAAACRQLDAGCGLVDLMGGRTDALKFVSSVTLFHAAATALHAAHGGSEFDAVAAACDAALRGAAREGFGPCRATLAALER